MNNIQLKLNITTLCCAIIFSVSSSPLFAKNLGVYGDTYQILEDDLLQVIKNRLTTLSENGELSKQTEEWKNKVLNYSNRPTSVGVPNTTVARVYTFDPSIQVQNDIVSPNGEVIAKAGTLFNPLSVISLHKILIFYNGDDKEQTEWVNKTKSNLDIKHIEYKLILVNGSVSQYVNKFKKPIYFDQRGELVKRFGITQVPAIVRQEGLVLRIEEIKP